MPTLHVHADESGDLNFNPHGSDHYTFAVAWTEEPHRLARELRELRYSLLRDGTDVPRFHASDDQHKHRLAVIERLAGDDSWSFCAAVVRKDRVFQHLQKPRRFYPKFLAMPLRFVFRGCVPDECDRVLIYTDRIPIEKRKKGVAKAIRQSCGAELGDLRFHVYHHPSASNAWLQVADYCCWSVHRKHEHDDDTYYQRLRPRLERRELYLWKS